MTVEAESLTSRAKSSEVKASCKKVFEALRYSDPMSSPELSVIEAKITVKLDELSSAVVDDNEKMNEIANEIFILVEDRDKRCRALK